MKNELESQDFAVTHMVLASSKWKITPMEEANNFKLNGYTIKDANRKADSVITIELTSAF